MADLATKIGISKITVSRALSGHPLVKDSTRQRVIQVAEEMGYRLNVAARNLRQQRSHTIAVVIEMTPSHERSMREPYPLSLLGGIMQELTEHSINMVLTTIELFSNAPPSVDGVILLGQGVHEDAVGIVQRTGLPYVIWGSADGDASHITVGSDNVTGGRLAAEHMLSQGKREFVFLGDTQHLEIADRLDGFAARIEEAGAHLVTSISCSFTESGGREAMLDALAEAQGRIDGVFASNDAIAVGAMAALSDNGLEMPKDVSVVGFDNSPSAAFIQPTLTSISQDWETGGLLLARKIIALTNGHPATSRVMPVRLEARCS